MSNKSRAAGKASRAAKSLIDQSHVTICVAPIAKTLLDDNFVKQLVRKAIAGYRWPDVNNTLYATCRSLKTGEDINVVVFVCDHSTRGMIACVSTASEANEVATEFLAAVDRAGGFANVVDAYRAQRRINLS